MEYNRNYKEIKTIYILTLAFYNMTCICLFNKYVSPLFTEKDIITTILKGTGVANFMLFTTCWVSENIDILEDQNSSVFSKIWSSIKIFGPMSYIGMKIIKNALDN